MNAYEIGALAITFIISFIIAAICALLASKRKDK